MILISIMVTVFLVGCVSSEILKGAFSRMPNEGIYGVVDGVKDLPAALLYDLSFADPMAEVHLVKSFLIPDMVSYPLTGYRAERLKDALNKGFITNEKYVELMALEFMGLFGDAGVTNAYVLSKAGMSAEIVGRAMNTYKMYEYDALTVTFDKRLGNSMLGFSKNQSAYHYGYNSMTNTFDIYDRRSHLSKEKGEYIYHNQAAEVVFKQQGNSYRTINTQYEKYELIEIESGYKMYVPGTAIQTLYNEQGQVLEDVEHGRMTTYHYDQDKISGVTVTNLQTNAVTEVQYIYNEKGQLINIKDHEGELPLVYDGDALVKIDGVYTFEYDEQHLITSVIKDGERLTETKYDRNGAVTGYYNPELKEHVDVVVDSNRHVSTVRVISSLGTETFAFDAQYRLRAYQDYSKDGYSLEYNEAGYLVGVYDKYKGYIKETATGFVLGNNKIQYYFDNRSTDNKIATSLGDLYFTEGANETIRISGTKSFEKLSIEMQYENGQLKQIEHSLLPHLDAAALSEEWSMDEISLSQPKQNLKYLDILNSLFMPSLVEKTVDVAVQDSYSLMNPTTKNMSIKLNQSNFALAIYKENGTIRSYDLDTVNKTFTLRPNETAVVQNIGTIVGSIRANYEEISKLQKVKNEEQALASYIVNPNQHVQLTQKLSGIQQYPMLINGELDYAHYSSTATVRSYLKQAKSKELNIRGNEKVVFTNNGEKAVVLAYPARFQNIFDFEVVDQPALYEVTVSGETGVKVSNIPSAKKSAEVYILGTFDYEVFQKEKSVNKAVYRVSSALTIPRNNTVHIASTIGKDIMLYMPYKLRDSVAIEPLQQPLFETFAMYKKEQYEFTNISEEDITFYTSGYFDTQKLSTTGEIIADDKNQSSKSMTVAAGEKITYTRTAKSNYGYIWTRSIYADRIKVERKIVSIIPTTSNKKFGTVSTEKNAVVGESTTITATPKKGYLFKGWYINEELVSRQASYTFEAERRVTLQAQFIIQPKEILNAKELEPKKDIPVTKEWVVTFSEPMDIFSISTEYIKLYNSMSEEVEIEVSLIDDKSLGIVPVNGYTFNESYLLVIEKMTAISGKSLNQPVRLRFDIVAEEKIEQIEEQEARSVLEVAEIMDEDIDEAIFHEDDF